ncbi:uncharacterized protein [Dermacentor andersoni]|nr:uncharacterized protein LOC126544687 isoform X2 [Dermacentor andersoni]
MEKAGSLAVSVGQTAKLLFNAFMRGVHKKMNESHHHSSSASSTGYRKTKLGEKDEGAQSGVSETVPAAMPNTAPATVLIQNSSSSKRR